MNGHIENKWARVPKAWEDLSLQGTTSNEEALINNDTDLRTLGNPDIDGMLLSYQEEINKEENVSSVSPPTSHKTMTKVSNTQEIMPLPQFVETLKNLLEVAPTVLQREEQGMEVEWEEVRDECVRVTEEGLTSLQRDVAKSLVTVLDSLDRGQRLRRRGREAERRTEKERWRKSHAELEKWMRRLVEKPERGRRTEGWSSEKEDEEDEEEEAVSGMRQRLQMAMDKAESDREQEVTESDTSTAKQELAIMEVLMDQLGAVEETCRRHCNIMQNRMAHLWETIEKNRSARTDNCGINEQYRRSVSPLAVLQPCLVRGRRPLLPPITSLTEEGGKHGTVQTGTGAPTQGAMWHMEPLSENHRERKKRRKKKVETKEGDEEEEVIEKHEEKEDVRKTWKQRLTEWLHAPLCGCAVRCY